MAWRKTLRGASSLRNCTLFIIGMLTEATLRPQKSHSATTKEENCMKRTIVIINTAQYQPRARASPCSVNHRRFTKNINHQQMHKEFFSSIVTHSYVFRHCWVIFREKFLLSLHYGCTLQLSENVLLTAYCIVFVLHIMDNSALILQQLQIFILNFLKNAVCSLFKSKKHSRKCAV
jgi:hypothetical protein